jgi:hypothetical protein
MSSPALLLDGTHVCWPPCPCVAATSGHPNSPRSVLVFSSLKALPSPKQTLIKVAHIDFLKQCFWPNLGKWVTVCLWLGKPKGEDFLEPRRNLTSEVDSGSRLGDIPLKRPRLHLFSLLGFGRRTWQAICPWPTFKCAVALSPVDTSHLQNTLTLCNWSCRPSDFQVATATAPTGSHRSTLCFYAQDHFTSLASHRQNGAVVCCSLVYSWFVYVIKHCAISFFELNSAPPSGRATVSNHSSTGGRVGCLCVSPTLTKAAVNMERWCLSRSWFPSLQLTPRTATVAHVRLPVLLFGAPPSCVPHQSHGSVFPALVYKGSGFPTSSPALVLFFKNRYPDRCEVTPRCGFVVHETQHIHRMKGRNHTIPSSS